MLESINNKICAPLAMLLVYVVCLAGVLGYGVYVYGSINWASDGSTLLPPQIWGTNEAYRQYLQNTGRILAIMLGAFSAASGAALGSKLVGFGLLLAGAGLTAGGWSLLPRVYFPGGSMTPWLWWLAENIYLMAGAWVVITAVQALWKTAEATEA